MAENEYYAVIGDLVASRKINDRQAVQQQLLDTFNAVNQQFSDQIAARFAITLGDEFQGVLTAPDHLFEIVDRIRLNLHPVQIRIGIGIGAISTEINQMESFTADGPAYYQARAMIDEVRKNENARENLSQTIKISTGEPNPLIDLINSNLGLASLIERNWTDKQIEAVCLMYFADSMQKDAAKSLGITVSGMHYRLKNAYYFDFKASRELVTQTLIERSRQR
jgi:hypothetical protein